MQFGAMLLGKGHAGEDISLCLIHNGGQFRDLGTDLIGDGAPLAAGRLGRFLGERGGDKGRDNASSALTGVGQHVSHEVNPAALPGSAEHFGDSGFDRLMGIRDHQLDAAQAPAREFAQEACPDWFGFGGSHFHAQNLAPAVRIDAHQGRP